MKSSSLSPPQAQSSPPVPSLQSPVSALILLHNVSKSYGSGEATVHAVKQVNLTVQAGEFVLLLGPSGSGKTTLLSLIGGLVQPTSGAIVVAGTDVGNLTPKALAQFRLRQIGFVFQFFQLFAALTAQENVEVTLRLGGYPPQTARREAKALLHRFGLGHRLRHLPSQLSGGEKQRVALARALSLQPPILIADEPTGSLDSRTGEEVIRLLRQLVDEENRTVLVASHDPRLERVITRVLRCEDGRIREEPNVQLLS
jgi:putative ABC transport system ATP-binding protein